MWYEIHYWKNGYGQVTGALVEATDAQEAIAKARTLEDRYDAREWEIGDCGVPGRLSATNTTEGTDEWLEVVPQEDKE